MPARLYNVVALVDLVGGASVWSVIGDALEADGDGEFNRGAWAYPETFSSQASWMSIRDRWSTVTGPLEPLGRNVTVYQVGAVPVVAVISPGVPAGMSVVRLWIS